VIVDSDIITQVKNVTGIIAAQPLADDHRSAIIALEQQAEKQALMGLGQVINTGIRKVLTCPAVCIALTDMNFDWGCQPALVLTKDQQVVGEEIRDEARIKALSENPDVWFMHRNFVIYKDRIQFPGDLMQNGCRFEIPWLTAHWIAKEEPATKPENGIFATPAPPTDLYLKEHYFDGYEAEGSGTILVGFLPCDDGAE
jgi:hypothetical protein